MESSESLQFEEDTVLEQAINSSLTVRRQDLQMYDEDEGPGSKRERFFSGGVGRVFERDDTRGDGNARFFTGVENISSPGELADNLSLSLYT